MTRPKEEHVSGSQLMGDSPAVIVPDEAFQLSGTALSLNGSARRVGEGDDDVEERLRILVDFRTPDELVPELFHGDVGELSLTRDGPSSDKRFDTDAPARAIRSAVTFSRRTANSSSVGLSANLTMTSRPEFLSTDEEACIIEPEPRQASLMYDVRSSNEQSMSVKVWGKIRTSTEREFSTGLPCFTWIGGGFLAGAGGAGFLEEGVPAAGCPGRVTRAEDPVGPGGGGAPGREYPGQVLSAALNARDPFAHQSVKLPNGSHCL
ncbi:uncharacterized protein C8Q71DRAFT_724686 [Rhodofomes roseus]|uniref:Uncharacterized protein n=1 Tax=Rhodofomes roseus TaxID=34475 RepID=A0ABQ8KCP7_9APHY|nr:uncharacterized protein C8Q71DRAFT_724686 [Rhodofomes roseus]KAH9835373.1 hypothetical protein C8Q71DRAFT_724686 [Rhodofomes roseus]